MLDIILVQILDVKIWGSVGMTGSELAARRKLLGYGQAELMREFGINSRQTLSSWENSDEIPRIVYLALRALELDIESRLLNGKRMSGREWQAHRQRLWEGQDSSK